ncbi:MAG: hypothetical protein JKX92_15985 [Porticoccaceae bacterium]|nr:hypothetical protein [Porticoccaceae bacterium]
MKEMVNLNSNQPEWLSPEEYQIIVGPSLKVSAELAASRGDPKLYQDLACMLCLMHLVSRLKDFYVDEWAVMSAMPNEELLQKAPGAVCIMVLMEGHPDKNQTGAMVESLTRAYQKVIDANIMADTDIEIQRAWQAIKESKHEQFLALLEQAAKKFVMVLDGWERTHNT